jgi:hypothetical protein
MRALDPMKDVDGLHPFNAGQLFQGRQTLVPATPVGIMQLLDEYRIPVAGARAVVVGRSLIVGRPVAMLLLHPGTPRDEQAREQLASALPDAEVGAPDDLGVFEIALDADDSEQALQRVWDAVAASGTDDHVVFLEHPELPEHWRHRSGRPH